MEGREFDWFEDEEDIAVEAQRAVAVYVGGGGHLVLRQEAEMYGEDAVIVVEMGKVEALVKAICARAGLELRQQKDSTGAARQRRYRERHRNVTGDGQKQEELTV